ncbi:MAG: TatD family nuclease-associated radical SAM protein [Clostridiales bacterium]|nr:TatD family nuclease-associated radical SAM protein [Clostridiales bacterium]
MNNIVYPYGDNLYINLTNRCSNACVFCIRGKQDGLNGHTLWLKKEPTAAEVIEALTRKNFKSAPEVVFCGYGEPTCRVAEIAEVGGFLKRHGVPARLNTNGQGNLINGRDITGELAAAIDTVSISLNNSTAERYQAVCRSRFGLDGYRAMLDFTRLCVPKFKRAVMTVVDAIGEREIGECREICEGLGAEFRVRVADSYV